MEVRIPLCEPVTKLDAEFVARLCALNNILFIDSKISDEFNNRRDYGFPHAYGADMRRLNDRDLVKLRPELSSQGGSRHPASRSTTNDNQPFYSFVFQVNRRVPAFRKSFYQLLLVG